MRPVYIIGIGQTPVGEQWERSLRHIAHDAIMPAMRDAGIERADALYVGNMLSGELVGQEHLGALVADFVGLRGIEAVKVEAACGSPPIMYASSPKPLSGASTLQVEPMQRRPSEA